VKRDNRTSIRKELLLYCLVWAPVFVSLLLRHIRSDTIVVPGITAVLLSIKEYLTYILRYVIVGAALMGIATGAYEVRPHSFPEANIIA
jgi:hypothetical protein